MRIFRMFVMFLSLTSTLTVAGILSSPALAATDCAAVTGLWYDPALDGEGFNLIESDTGLVVTYYAYGDDGQRLWLVSEVLGEPIDFDTDLNVDMLVGEDGSFTLPLPPAQLSVWGGLTMNFSDSNHGLFSLSGVDGDKVSEVVRLAAARGQDCSAARCLIDSTTASRLQFANDGGQGVFDPSLAAGQDGGAVWLSYSTVSTSVQWPQQNASVIQNRLARSTDAGATFAFVAETNPVQDVTLDLAPPENAGSWVNEVSSLTYDAAAVPEQRWKLIWHHYLQINGVRHFEHGWLGYRAAASPEALAGAAEIKLFAAGLYDPVNDETGNVTHAPVGGAPLIDVRDLDPELANCAVLSEPGWLSNAAALYLAVGCFEISPRENRLILLACEHPCVATEPQAWRFVATLLVNTDAEAVGFERFSAPDLFSLNGRTYLWATPGSDSPFDDSYNGCRAYRFKDLATGTLYTDSNGLPVPALTLDGLPGTFNGACALHAATANRASYSQLMIGSPDRFQIFRASTSGCQITGQ